MDETPALPARSKDPFQELLAFHERLNRDLVAGSPVSHEDVFEFLALASRLAPTIESISERDELRYLLGVWGTFLAAQGMSVPEIDVPERVPLMPALLPEDHPDLQRLPGNGASVHIGVNLTFRHMQERSLAYGEATAWRLAELANQAGYQSVLVLRGRWATQAAVQDALIDAAKSLKSGDTFFLSFSGFGSPDRDADEMGGGNSWYLFDGELMEERLTAYLTLFDPGVRILIVEERCYSGGSSRDGGSYDPLPAVPQGPRSHRFRDGGSLEPDRVSRAGVIHSRSRVAEPPSGPSGIQASVLTLSASADMSLDGLFTRHLLDVWDEGAFRGSYYDLYQLVRERVLAEWPGQEPQIVMFGAPDPAFPLEPAFHLNLRPVIRRSVYR